MNDKPVVFIVDDETEVLAANQRMLERRGYHVDEADCVADAYAYLEVTTPDLMILDVMLPDGSGHDICRKFRETSENPVLFLSGKNDLNDKIEGLEQGADYYLTKPFQFPELLAVVRCMLAREQKRQQKKEKLTVLQKGPLKLDLQTGLVTVMEETVSLTGKEFGLLVVLMQNEGKELSGEELYERVWKTEPGKDVRTVRKHIMNLRSKIHVADVDDYDIITSYGKGYMFC